MTLDHKWENRGRTRVIAIGDQAASLIGTARARSARLPGETRDGKPGTYHGYRDRRPVGLADATGQNSRLERIARRLKPPDDDGCGCCTDCIYIDHGRTQKHIRKPPS